MLVQLKHSSGITKTVKVGFSWTTFFFGFIVPLVRGDIKWAAIMFIVEVLIGSFTLGIGAWVAEIIFSFIYNKLYIKELLEKGYTTQNQSDDNIIKSYVNG